MARNEFYMRRIYTKAVYLHIAYYWATFIPSINNRIGRQFEYNEAIECDTVKSILSFSMLVILCYHSQCERAIQDDNDG